MSDGEPLYKVALKNTPKHSRQRDLVRHEHE